MSSKTPEKIKPKFILERIEELRRAGVSDDLIKEIEILADRCIPRHSIGGDHQCRGQYLL